MKTYSQSNSDVAHEKINLQVDRGLYIAGEKILFTASLITSKASQDTTSKVLYVEVIRPDGKSISAGKFLISTDHIDGCLSIPGETVSGFYYLRGYTKWMRNRGPATYPYVMIKVVNPFVEDVLTGKEGIPELGNSYNEYKFREGNAISMGSTHVQRNTTVEFNVQKNASSDYPGQYSLSIIPKGTQPFKFAPKPTVEPGQIFPQFYQETRGVSLTGQVKDLSTDQPLAGEPVNLSIIGKGRDFMAIESDGAGRFFFALPSYVGNRDVFLSVEKDSITQPRLLVDNDYCTIPVRLPAPAFSLDSVERELVYTLSRNAQLNKHFHADSIRCPKANELDEKKTFYGDPSEIIYFDEYVQLPTLEEYFNELPTPVKVRKKGGHKYFKVLGNHAELNYFDPLVLVDYVAVNHPEEILSASPQTISRIEVVTVPYVKGNITYGGIVSIISKKGNFAGIDLPSAGIFLNYQFISADCNCEVVAPVSPGPDTRNTVYWLPYVFPENETKQYSFVAPDTPGHYVIVVEGITYNGNHVISEKEFEVK